MTEQHIGRLTHEAVRDLFAQLAEGVHAIHEAGKLHRDLKPPNVLVSRDNRVVVLDFGLVRDLPEQRRSVGAGLYAFPENPGVVWGTPEFMAPEQAAGRETTRASDWYGFGVMFDEALTGQLPFAGDSEFVMTQKRLSEAPDPVDALERADALHMAMIGACLRHRLGQVLGGEEGRALQRDADAVFQAEGVRQPERLVTMYLSR